MSIVTKETVDAFREQNTREIEMPDGTKRAVRMTPALWNSLEFIEEFEGFSATDIAAFALEEAQLQDVSFNRAFRGVVAYLANLWTM
jgi:hypothetical protein